MKHITSVVCSKMQLSSTSFTDQLEAQKTKNSSQLSENEKVNLHKNSIQCTDVCVLIARLYEFMNLNSNQLSNSTETKVGTDKAGDRKNAA